MKSARILAIAALLLSGAGPTAVAKPAAKLDVVIVVCDDFNAFYTGFGGDPDAKTPNLDALAKESAVFTRSYTTSPVCMPSRTSLVSGLYPHNTGLWGNARDFYLTPAHTPMFRDLKKSGYTTAMIGKTHWLSGSGYRREFATLEDYFRAMGIDHFKDLSTTFGSIGGKGVYEEYLRKIGKFNAQKKDLTERLRKDQYAPIPSLLAAEETSDWMVTDLAIDYLRKAPSKEPFALMIGFSNPHSPMDPSGKYATMYDPARLTLRENVAGFRRGETEVTMDDIRKTRAAYLGKISFLDDLVGKLVQALKDRGSWEKTLLVFTADHGMHVGEQGRISKGVFWEESVRIPLFIRIPGVTDEGIRTEALAQLHDVYPTVIEAVGGRPSPGIFAKSQLPVLQGRKPAVRDSVFCEIMDRDTLGYMVRNDRYKWFQQRGREYLFDLEVDPFEKNNLAGVAEHEKTASFLRNRLRQFLMTEQINYSAGYTPVDQRVRAGENAEEAVVP